MRPTAAISAAVLVLAAGLAGTGVRHQARARAALREDSLALAHELWIHEQDIRFFEAKLAEDPRSAYHAAMLARTYLQHARETGQYEDYQRAEQLVRQSLAIRTSHNAASFAVLASALMAEHRFGEALVAAESAATGEDWVPQHRAMVGEIAFEMGRYPMADSIFGTLRGDARHLDIAPRMSRWLELHGRTDDARVMLANAFDDALRMHHLPRETVAWFALRLGDLEMRAGNLDAAERDYRRGLEIFPLDYRLESAMARLSLERGRNADAVRHGEAAIHTVLDPATLGTLADAHAALGNRARAEELTRIMEMAVTAQAGPIHRQWELFLLDHDRDVNLVAGKAELELATRTDVYGWDALAWARFKQGRFADAKLAMDSALALGTRDVLLERHRNAIAAALRGVQSRPAAAE